MAPRSSWKISHVSNELVDRLSRDQFFSDESSRVAQLGSANPSSSHVSNVFFVSRSSTVTPDMVGAKVAIHTGSSFRTLKIRKDFLGLKYGEFAYTRAPVKHKIVVAKKAPTKK